MPEHIRALIIVLVLSAIVFAFAHRPACAIAGAGNYVRKRNLWILLTLTAFLAHSFWLYALIAIPLVVYAYSRETNPPALFFFILFVLPVAGTAIPGMGLINYFFELSHVRILELFILFPAFLLLLRRSGVPPFGKMWPDRLLAAYIFLIVALQLRDTTVTDTARQAFYMFIDVFLPYFVISRSLKSVESFRTALLSFVLAAMVNALIAVFETFRYWPLYHSVLIALGLDIAYGGNFGAYILRDGMLRATATAGQPIALGYLMVTGAGLYLFLQRSIRQRLIRWLGMALLAAGLIASLSRGPWVGAVALLVIFLATGRYAVPRLTGFALAAVFAFSVIAVLPGGEKVINLLPFIGTTEKGTIEGRQQLLTASIDVIMRNPLFGSVNYLEAPEMQSMRTGLGIIDIVNSYLQVALKSGLVGLGLFVGFFALTLLGIYRAMRSVRDRGSEERLLGQALLATLLTILVIIFTVSSITVIPVIYWSVAGLGVAYAQIIRSSRLSRKHVHVDEKTEVPYARNNGLNGLPVRSKRS
ncbi:MAG: O-antigen ligase family protein [Sulfuricaulis sp.]